MASSELFVNKFFQSLIFFNFGKAQTVTNSKSVTTQSILIPPHITAVWHKKCACWHKKLTKNRTHYSNFHKECTDNQKKDLQPKRT
jgi:hypothetical protein